MHSRNMLQGRSSDRLTQSRGLLGVTALFMGIAGVVMGTGYHYGVDLP